MNLSKKMDEWFLKAEALPTRYQPNEIANISENIYFKYLPDGSRELGDMISVIGSKTKDTGILNVYFGSLLGKKNSVDSFSFETEIVTSYHRHNYIELAFIVEGRLKISFIDHDELFSQGEICIIDKETKHGDHRLYENALIIYLGISNTFFEDSFLNNSELDSVTRFVRDIIIKRKDEYQYVRCIPKHKNTNTIKVLGNLLDEIHNIQAGRVRIVQGYVERILSLLPREYSVSLKKSERDKTQRLLFEDVKEFIQKNLQNISICRLSNAFGYNDDYYARLIRRYTGMNYAEFVKNMRLKKAAYNLKSTSLSIDQIARNVGYSNISFFYRAFNESYGMTPNEYRNQ